ncbi:CAP domain-containing protein [Arenibacter sp. N53]|uniref:CAP domain-containing protein n=1 Tax=Arenibacter TaxID=178469 RepID=UPI000CD40DE8|nr:MULTISPECIES: CAP domain-containing protein [Arenibacter]MCM4150509.1 CAP domain-containing protein [Arenibacter sp. N53]
MKTKVHYFIMLLFTFVVVSCSTEPIESAIGPVAENAVEVEQELLGIVNDHRISLGYTDLDYSAVAYEYANKHTDYMIAKGSINHDNFSARASDISQAVNASFVSENVAKDYDSAVEAFQNWLASSDHRKTMEGDFTHTAVSVKRNSGGKLYFTQLFYR